MRTTEEIENDINIVMQKLSDESICDNPDLLEEYRRIRKRLLKERGELLREKRRTELIRHVAVYNDLVCQARTIVPAVKKFKGKIHKANGFYTVAFLNYIREFNPDNLRIDINQDGSMALHRSNLIYINVYEEGDLHNLKTVDINEVIKAQQKHNELLGKISAIESEISVNYALASVDRTLRGAGMKYRFDEV